MVEISGKEYRVLDWSLGGVGIENFSVDTVEDRGKIGAHVILPMPDAVVSLLVYLGSVSQHGKKRGLRL